MRLFLESIRACGVPPEADGAVIISHEYQEVFAEDSEVQYQCENRIFRESGDKTSIFCKAGNWTEPPKCCK